MQRLVRLLVVSLIVLLLRVPDSFAIGLGAFTNASGGSGELEWDSGFSSWDINSKALAFGFVLDTAPTNERTFNYRLNVGFERQNLKDDYDITIKSKGIYAENIFGFALIKTEDFRWWGGPLVRIGYYSGDAGTVQVFYSDISGTGQVATIRSDMDYAEVGVGAVTGLNFKVGNAILSPSVGFRISGIAGEGKTTVRDSFGTFYYEEDFEGNTSNIFVNFAVLF